MRIIIAGAGDLGTYLVERLAKDGHHLSVIDVHQAKLERLSDKYDLAVFKGNALTYDNLQAIGAKDADLFVAVTESEELNLMTCILAKRMGTKRTVARTRHAKLASHDDTFRFSELGIDSIISPDALVADEIELLLDKRIFTDLIPTANGEYYIAGLEVEQGDRFEGLPLARIREIDTQHDFTPIAFLREEETHLLHEDTLLSAGDLVYFVVDQGGIGELVRLTQHTKPRGRRVMIIGGSRAGIDTARRLYDKKYQVTLIESSRAFAEEMADFLPEALIIHGNVDEPGFLEDHDIEDMDALVAATDDPPLNIVSCLTARKHGVANTIALVKDTHYLHLAHEFGVDKLINKKMLAADIISAAVHTGNIISVASVPGLAMEVIGFVVQEHSPITTKKVSELELVQQSRLVLAGVCRHNTCLPQSTDITLQAGDTVTVACHQSCKEEVQQML